MIYCPSCGTANRDGSRFCNECGTKLPTATSVRCPTCGTLNPPSTIFCEKCGTRLIAMPMADEPSEPEPAAPIKKGLSLPTKSSTAAPGPSAEDEVPDWLSQLQSTSAGSSGAEQPGSVPSDQKVAPSAEERPEQPARPIDRSASSRAAEPPAGASTRAKKASAAPSAAPTEQAAEAMPDWLAKLGLGSAGQAGAQSSAVDLPDWLNNLPTASLAAPQPSGESKPEEEIPEWLSQLGASAETQPPAETRVTETPSSAEEEGPAWLSQFGAAREAQPSEETSQAEEASDWLKTLRAAAPSAETEPIHEEQPPGEELPAWLSQIGVTGGAQPPVETPQAEEPSDWLSALRAAAPAAELEPTPEEQPSAEELPAWLSQIGVTGEAQPPVEAPPIEESSDWLSALRAATPSAEAEPTPEEQPPVEQPSDWLSVLRSATPSVEAEPPTEEQPQVEQPSDWMSVLRAATPAAEAEQAPEEQASVGEVPEWLSQLGATTEAAQPVEPAEVPDWLKESKPQPAMPGAEAAPAEEVPEWLQNLGMTAAAPAQPAPEAEVPEWMREETAAAEAAPESAELPDWLREAETTQATAEAPQPAPSGQVAPAVELPEWLTGISRPAAPAEPAPSAAPAEMPAWAHGLTGVPVPPEQQPETEAVAPAELPGWLKSLREGRGAAPAQPAEPLPGLTQAEIPAWVEALRPKEDAEAQAPVEEREVEKEGILAGLAKVLPASALMSEVQGRPARLRIETSADDQARAGVFQQLLTRPTSAPTVVVTTSRGARARRRIMQWVFVLLLLLATLPPGAISLNQLLGLELLPSADRLPPAPYLQSAFRQIAALPKNANVLIAFDYDAMQAGEMNQVAQVMLRHLAANGAHIKPVSLNPLGPGLAQSVADSIDQKLRTSGQVAPPIYVAGQSIGVQQLLLESGPLDLVVDLAASSDSVRWWIEQLSISGRGVPLVAGVSAGAEPLTLPYAQAGQVRGFVSGVVGATMYAQQAGQLPALPPLEATRVQVQLEAQTLAHWLLAIIIAVSLIGALFSRAGRRSST